MINKSMMIEEAINFFGHSVEDKAFDEYLAALGIQERPEFEENPMEWVGEKEEGFIFMFRARLGYEKTFGLAKDKGSMILNSIRLYGRENTDGYLEYKNALPKNLSFSKKIDEVKNILGNPSLDDEASGEENRLCVWNNISLFGENLFLSINFFPHDGPITFLTVSQVKLLR